MTRGDFRRDTEQSAAARLEVVGVGRPGDAPELDERGAGDAARADRRADPAPRAAELEDVRAAARRAAAPRRWSTRSAPRTSSPRPRTGSATRPAAATPTSPGCARAASTPRPTRSSCPPTPSRCAACSRPARRRASPSSPSAAAPASSAASSRCAAPHERLISLDLARLRGVEVDRRSLTATLGAGLRGPEAEAALAAQGLVLGHFPQSFEYATIGGFAATRSAGQASSGYGRFDALVSSVRLIAPAGELRTLETPHTAAGPALRELIVGSEGTLGVIPDVTVRVRPAPERAPLRGLDRRGLRGRGGDRPRPRPGARPARRDPGLRRGGDPGLAGPVGAARPGRRPLRPLPGPAPPRRRLPDDRRPRGRARSRSPAAGRSPCASCAPAAPPTWARRPGAPGSTAATRAPTCATR